MSLSGYSVRAFLNGYVLFKAIMKAYHPNVIWRVVVQSGRGP